MTDSNALAATTGEILLHQTSPQSITMHIRATREEGELELGPTCKPSLQVCRGATRGLAKVVSP